METLKIINFVIATLFFMCYTYQFFYIPVVWLRREMQPYTPTPHRYAALICARNESAVIGNLLDSIRAQTYPADQVTVFVVADNCTDDTAAICRSKGAVVYERFDPAHARKGYAMQFLVDRLRSSGEFSSCDGFFVVGIDKRMRFFQRL